MLKPGLVIAALLSAQSVAAQALWQGTLGIAAGRGEKGPWQQHDSRYDYVDDPAVAIGADGCVAVAWVDQARKDVFFRRLAPHDSGASSEPVNVSRNGNTFSWLPRIEHAPGAPGTVYLLWQEIIFSGGSHGGDILFARSVDGGRTFTDPLNLSDSAGGDGKGRINAKTWHNGSLDLATAAGGMVYAAWTEYEGALWFSRSVDGGRSFSHAQRVAGGADGKPVRAPSLAAGKNGVIYLAWTHGEDAGADIHLAVSADGGARFSAPAPVASGRGYADAPKLALGADGVLHLVHAQGDGGPFGRFRIHYTRSRDGGRSFEPTRDISSPLPAYAESARYPYFAIDTAGRMAVAYELYPDHREDPRGLGISVSVDGGKSFSPSAVPGSAGPPGGTNGSHQGWLMEKLALDSEGTIAIVNSSLVQGRQSRVWLVLGSLGTTADRRRANHCAG